MTSPSRRRRVEALFEEWCAHRERGAMPEAERLLEAHPDVADELRARIQAIALLDQALEEEASARPTPDRNGKLGRYRIVKEIGSGGMGTVYRAEVAGDVPGLSAGATVALKVIHRHLLRRPGFLERFRREAEIGQRVFHANVVRTFSCDTAVADGSHEHFLVLEHVEGQTLRQFLQDLGRVPEELCRHVGREVARGLVAIHSVGAVHRDLKPENILITKDHVVKVMDLGVASLAEEAVRLSLAGSFVGSLHYSAPEQLRAEGDVDARADLFALGLLLYELSTGVHPFRHDDVRVVLRRMAEEAPRPCAELDPQLSPFFDEIVRALLAKDRRDRPGSADEVLRILDQGEGSPWWREKAQAVRRATRRPPRKSRVPRETALYGREVEIAALRALYRKAKGGDGQVVLVEGEAGIGKSRLADEFVGLLEQEGEDLNVLVGSHPPGGAATATGAFTSAYLEHFGDQDIEDVLRTHLAQTPRLVPAFAAHLRGEPRPTHEEPLTRDALQAAFVDATRSLAKERPTIVMIEDLHFATEDGRGLFAALALAVHGHRILLIGTSRPGLPETWTHGLGAGAPIGRITPVRLGPKDLTRLLASALGSERTAGDLAFQIAAKSDGNPFFVFEILRGLRKGGFLTRRPDGTWVTTGALREIEIPPSLVEVVEGRLAGLDPDEREILDVAACCGFEFDPLLVGEAVGVPPLVALQRLARIERSQRLIHSVGARCTFDHHTVQEALVSNLPGPLCAAYHAAIAQALETRAGAASKDPKDLDGNLCVGLAEHFLLGGCGERAERFLRAALAHLEMQDRLEAAVLLSGLALTAPGLLDRSIRVDVLCRRAASLWGLGRTRDACEAAAEAVHLADEAGDPRARLGAADALSHVLRATSRERARLELAEKALEFARLCGARVEEPNARAGPDRGSRAPARAAASSVSYPPAEFQSEEPGEWQERSAALCRQIGSRRGEMYAILSLALESHRLGLLETARLQYERGLTLARELQEQRASSMNEVWLGSLLASLGLTQEARDCLGRSVSTLGTLGARVSESLAWQSLGELERESGDEGAALAAFAAALEIQGSLEDFVAVAETRLGRATLLARLGRVEDARADLLEARRPTRGGESPEISVLAAAHLACLPGGDAASALAEFERYGRRLSAGWAMEARFALWRATGDPAHLADAKQRLDFLIEHAPPECRKPMVANVRLHRAIVLASAERVA